MTQPDEKAALHAVARPGFPAVTRARVLPVVLGPVVIGSTVAWARAGVFSWPWFAVTLAGATAGHLSFNVFRDVIDESSGADAAARADALSVPTGSGFVSTPGFTRLRALRLAAALLVASAGAGVALAAARSPVSLLFGAAAFALAMGAFVPPIRYGSRAPGLAEAGAVVAAMLQAGAAYAVQTGRLDLAGLRIGVVPGLLIALVVYHEQFLRYRADRAIGRPSTISRLGSERAVAVSAALILVTFGALVAQVALGVWPAYALVALVAAVPLSIAYVRVKSEIGPLQNFLTLFGATLGSTVTANVLLGLALVVEGLRYLWH